jgi:hypothetical protein
MVFAILISNSAIAGIPQNIRVTNVHGASFTVSWTTRDNEGGQVKYGTDPASYSNWQIADDDRGADVEDDIHYITISDLSQNILYYFEIFSGESSDNNRGRYYSVNSGSYAVPPPGDCAPAGKIYKDLSMTQSAYDSIVYVTILGANVMDDSATESVLYTSKLNGYWFIDLINFRNHSNTDFYPFACESNSIFVEVHAGSYGSARIANISKDFSTSGEIDPIIVTPQTAIGNGDSRSGGCFVNTINSRPNFNFIIAMLIILLILYLADIHKESQTSGKAGGLIFEPLQADCVFRAT